MKLDFPSSSMDQAESRSSSLRSYVFHCVGPGLFTTAHHTNVRETTSCLGGSNSAGEG
jgi:hypothetical protein